MDTDKGAPKFRWIKHNSTRNNSERTVWLRFVEDMDVMGLTPFEAREGLDISKINGRAKCHQTKLQCISAMEEFMDFSMEEVRLYDYSWGRHLRPWCCLSDDALPVAFPISDFTPHHKPTWTVAPPDNEDKDQTYVFTTWVEQHETEIFPTPTPTDVLMASSSDVAVYPDSSAKPSANPFIVKNANFGCGKNPEFGQSPGTTKGFIAPEALDYYNSFYGYVSTQGIQFGRGFSPERNFFGHCITYTKSRLMCIAAMEEYSNKSLEELRFEDLQQRNKTLSQNVNAIKTLQRTGQGSRDTETVKVSLRQMRKVLTLFKKNMSLVDQIERNNEEQKWCGTLLKSLAYEMDPQHKKADLDLDVFSKYKKRADTKEDNLTAPSSWLLSEADDNDNENDVHFGFGVASSLKCLERAKKEESRSSTIVTESRIDRYLSQTSEERQTDNPLCLDKRIYGETTDILSSSDKTSKVTSTTESSRLDRRSFSNIDCYTQGFCNAMAMHGAAGTLSDPTSLDCNAASYAGKTTTACNVKIRETIACDEQSEQTDLFQVSTQIEAGATNTTQTYAYDNVITKALLKNAAQIRGNTLKNQGKLPYSLYESYQLGFCHGECKSSEDRCSEKFHDVHATKTLLDAEVSGSTNAANITTLTGAKVCGRTNADAITTLTDAEVCGRTNADDITTLTDADVCGRSNVDDIASSDKCDVSLSGASAPKISDTVTAPLHVDTNSEGTSTDSGIDLLSSAVDNVNIGSVYETIPDPVNALDCHGTY